MVVRTVVWREKERSRIWAVKTDNLRGLLGIKRMDKVLNPRIRELCGVTKGVDEDVLRWFGHVGRMENNGTAKRVYVGSVRVVGLWVSRRRGELIP